MSIVLIHGNAVIAKLNKISAFKKDFDPLSISEFNGKSLSLLQVLPEISTGGLFTEKRLVVLEDFENDLNLDIIPDDESLTVILKFSKPLPANSKILKQANLKKITIFNLTEKDETSIFPFLDNLSEKKKTALKDLDPLLSELGGQYLLTMIFYMLRRLITTPKNLPPFVIKKIESQKRNFSIDKVIDLYKEGLETDLKIKSGLIDEKTGLTLLVNKIIY